MNEELRLAKARIVDATRVWRGLTPPGVTLRHLFIEGAVDTESPDVLCETKTQWEYHQACMRWSLSNCAGQSQDEIDQTYVHEMMHVYLGAIEQEVRTNEGDNAHYVNAVCEHTVEALAQAFLRLVP